MKEEDNISERYRILVDEQLDNQSDTGIIYPLNPEELNKIWEEVSIELDIDEVWSSITSDLDIVMPENSGSGIIFRSIAAVLIILIAIIPVMKLGPENQSNYKSDIPVEARQNDQKAELITKGKPGGAHTGEPIKGEKSPPVNRYPEKSENVNEVTSAKENKSGLADGILIPFSNKLISKVLATSEMVNSSLIISSDKMLIEKSGIQPALLRGDPKKIKLVPTTEFDNLRINDNSSAAGNSLPLIDRRRFSGGIITSFNNTWLLNHETFDGFRYKSQTTTRFEFFPDIGLSLDYSLKKSWFLQADGFFYSNTGQKYNGYYYGHYGLKRITLRYSTLALTVKRKFGTSGSFPPGTSINLQAGIYFSVLQQANQEIITDIDNIASQCQKFDLGVRLGGEVEVPLISNLSMAPGFSLSIGIPNIYKGYVNVPATHNGSEGFHLTFYYHFN